jgi:hypothetical protein
MCMLACWAGQGEKRGRMTCAWIARQNLDQSLVGTQLRFAVYFCYVSNVFLIWTTNWLRDDITLGGFPLLICMTAAQIKIHPMNPQIHLGFRLLRCCTAKTSSSRSSMCIYDRESRSPEYRPQWSYTERGWIRFLRSVLHDCSIALSSLSSYLIYLFIGRAPIVVVVCNALSSRLSGIFSTQPFVEEEEPW